MISLALFWIAYKIYSVRHFLDRSELSNYEEWWRVSFGAERAEYSFFFAIGGIGSLIFSFYIWYSNKKQWQQTNKIFP